MSNEGNVNIQNFNCDVKLKRAQCRAAGVDEVIGEVVAVYEIIETRQNNFNY